MVDLAQKSDHALKELAMPANANDRWASTPHQGERRPFIQGSGRWAVASRGSPPGAARQAGLDDPLTDEPWRSSWTPDSMRGLLARHGFVVRSDEDLSSVAARVTSPTTNRRSIGTGRVAIATT